MSATGLNPNQANGYDPAGNVINDGTNQYLYDGDGRICAVAQYVPVLGTFTYTGYLYDAEGTRVAKGSLTAWSCDPALNGFQTTNDYVLGPGGEQAAEMGVDVNSGSANTLVWQHTNVWAAGALIATYDNDGLHFYFNDPLGTRRVQTDYAGVVEQKCQSLPFGDGESCGTTPTEHLFTGKERDTESGNDYFGARYYASGMGRFMSPDPAGVAFSSLSNPQSWNLYSYVLNNPLIHVDPDGRECAWEDGSFDSKDDPDTGSYSGCSAAGGIYYDPSTFNLGNGQDWSSSANATIAGQVADAEALQASLPQGPDPSTATGSNTSTNGTTTTIDLFGPNWQSTQVSTGTHPWRDNNPGDIISGRFVNNHGAIGADGRFGVFPTAGTGSSALDSLLHSPTYSSKSISDAISTYAPAFENNTAGYQQFLTNALGVSGNTPLSSLSSGQMQTLENAISRYEGYDARGNFSVTTTSVITPP